MHTYRFCVVVVFNKVPVPKTNAACLFWRAGRKHGPVWKSTIVNCSSDAVSVEALHDIHRSSAQAPILMKVQWVHRSLSSTVKTSHQFPKTKMNKSLKQSALLLFVFKGTWNVGHFFRFINSSCFNQKDCHS